METDRRKTCLTESPAGLESGWEEGVTGGFPQFREESQFGDDWIGPAGNPLGVQCGPCGVLRNHLGCETTCNIPRCQI